MSELKAYIAPTPDGTGLADYYLKSEADKVIAELKDKALQYKVLCKEKCRDINTQERHFALQVNYQKYKRCLAMAKLAVKDDYLPWNMKWHKRWLELAEKFKPTIKPPSRAKESKMNELEANETLDKAVACERAIPRKTNLKENIMMP